MRNNTQHRANTIDIVKCRLCKCTATNVPQTYVRKILKIRNNATDNMQQMSTRKMRKKIEFTKHHHVKMQQSITDAIKRQTATRRNKRIANNTQCNARKTCANTVNKTRKQQHETRATIIDASTHAKCNIKHRRKRDANYQCKMSRRETSCSKHRNTRTQRVSRAFIATNT